MMTNSRKHVYRRGWFNREIRIDMKNRKKEYHRKVRHMRIDEDSCSRGVIKKHQKALLGYNYLESLYTM